MATIPYAAAADLTTWLFPGAAPGADEAGRLLRNATILLDAALIGYVYNTDINLSPTDPGDIQAFNDACCAQVEYWLENGDEFGDSANLQGYSAEGLAVQYRKSPPRLAPRAREILAIAGILPSVTPIHMP